jgi:ribosomal protein L11 methyltransferase
MTYKKTKIKITPPDETAKEILIAQMGELGYDSFMETDEGLEAYITSDLFQPFSNQEMPFLSSSDYSFEISTEDLEEKNWNEEWEKNYFKPIVIGSQCLVRSPFHEAPPKARYEILIEPRMAFGTGYHETTSLMIEHLLEFDSSDLKILDMGCGTGILGILASMRGAANIKGIDIDQWAVENAKHNITVNHVSNMAIFEGDATLLNATDSFDCLLANINRNILLQDLEKYHLSTKEDGTIFLSGFYSEDVEKINAKAHSLGWKHLSTKEQNNWVALSYRK